MKNASGNSWPISVYPPLPGLIDGTPSNNNYKPGFSAGMMKSGDQLQRQGEAPPGKVWSPEHGHWHDKK